MPKSCVAAMAVVVATASACGSSKTPAVQLDGGTQAAGGKALVLSASTDEKLATSKGGFYEVELRGIDSDSDDGSFDEPGYKSETRCILSPCEWTVVPAKASTYEFKAFLIDSRNDKAGGESDSVKLDWAAPPRPQGIKLFVNGETPPTTPLTDDDDYTEFPAGPLQVEAKWTTDASGTGYYVKIAADNRVYARCSTGTTCRVPGKVPLADNRLMTWTVELLTTKGNKVAGGFKVCLDAEV